MFDFAQLMPGVPQANVVSRVVVTPDQANLTAWMKAGAFCVGMGSNLFPKDVIAAQDWQSITQKCKESLSYIAAAKK